jgi:hypothetical protein
MKKTIIAIAKTSKTWDEFIDRIYAIDATVILDDDDENIVIYFDNNAKEHVYDMSAYTAKFTA